MDIKEKLENSSEEELNVLFERTWEKVTASKILPFLTEEEKKSFLQEVLPNLPHLILLQIFGEE